MSVTELTDERYLDFNRSAAAPDMSTTELTGEYLLDFNRFAAQMRSPQIRQGVENVLGQQGKGRVVDVSDSPENVIVVVDGLMDSEGKFDLSTRQELVKLPGVVGHGPTVINPTVR